MPSPFPGMDPFLEEPAGWSGVHSRLINTISDELAARLVPTFFVHIASDTELEIRPTTDLNPELKS